MYNHRLDVVNHTLSRAVSSVMLDGQGRSQAPVCEGVRGRFQVTCVFVAGEVEGGAVHECL